MVIKLMLGKYNILKKFANSGYQPICYPLISVIIIISSSILNLILIFFKDIIKKKSNARFQYDWISITNNIC